LWCQVDGEDLTPLRDRVLVPAVRDLAAQRKPDVSVMEDVVGLLALVPEPTDKDALAAWKATLAQLAKVQGSKMTRIYDERRAQAKRERTSPPPAMKRISFCGAADVVEDGGGTAAPGSKR
jgi:hypothetical protein